MNKLIGYILTVLGAIGIAAWSVPEIRKIISLPSSINDTTLIIASGAIALVGIFFILKGSRRQQKGMEVPIFHGRNVVGYRRTR